MNSLGGCLFRKAILSPSFLKDSFARYRILAWQLFSLNILNIASHSLLVWKVSVGNPLIVLWGLPCMWHVTFLLSGSELWGQGGVCAAGWEQLHKTELYPPAPCPGKPGGPALLLGGSLVRLPFPVGLDTVLSSRWGYEWVSQSWLGSRMTPMPAKGDPNQARLCTEFPDQVGTLALLCRWESHGLCPLFKYHGKQGLSGGAMQLPVYSGRFPSWVG